MNEDFKNNVDEFISDSIKIFCELPEMHIVIDAPDIEFSFSELKKKKKITIIEKTNDRRKCDTTKLF